MEDFSLGPVGGADWYNTKKVTDPKRRQRHHENPGNAEEEPVDVVELSSEDENGQPKDE